ncbi:MAG: putative DNA-binding domain-containing protein [Proteobacteria bacterium]|nr:putative DNA-binding domain-containing protein [Pseudomonadota bacterium]
MPHHAERLNGFADALLDAGRPMPYGLIDPEGQPDPRRFAVYRNNVMVGLIDALRANYPAVDRIVGEEFFSAMARDYVVLRPPASPVLLDYGDRFADFIATFEPAQSLPYLADVARIERAWTEAYHAREARPLMAVQFAQVRAGDAANTTLKVHPSLRLVRSRYPVLTVWRMNSGAEPLAPVDFEAGGEDTLVLRPDADVEVRAVPPGGSAILNALMEGKTLTEAAQSALYENAQFDLAGNLAVLIEAGAFIGCSALEQYEPWGHR